MIVDTLELYCPAWPSRMRLVQGFTNFVAAIESGAMVTYLPAPMTMSLPKKSNEASQTLTFAIDNVTGEAQRLLDMALEAEQKVTLTFRRYLDSDRTGPAERAFVATVLKGKMNGSTVQLTAGFFSLLDYAFPRHLFDLNVTPCLAYV